MLREYQIAICARVREALLKYRSVMVQMPTGTGKTLVLASLVKDSLSAEGQGCGILIVAHRRELIEQIKATIKRMGIANKRIVVESIQTVSRRMQASSDKGVQCSSFSLIVIDEAHHALAKTYRSLWEVWPKAKFLGLTATPWRMSGDGFTDLFDVLVESQGIKRFIADGWLCPYDYFAVRPDSDDQKRIDSLKKRGSDGDYQTKEKREKLDAAPCIERLFATYQQHAEGKKGIIYAIDIAHAEHIAAYYRQQGVDTLALSSRTPKRVRQEVVARFRKQGSPEVLVSVDLFSEGFDCPDVEFIQIARPTLSLAKYLQMVGRGLRMHAGKECCILIDHVGLYRAFGLPSADRAWEMAFKGMELEEGQVCGAGLSRLEGGMIASSLLGDDKEEVVKIVSHEGMANRFAEAVDVGFEWRRNVNGKRAWVDKANGVTFRRRPKVVDFSGLELSTDDGIVFFPRLASKLIDADNGIHLNLLKMQVGDGILWKRRYISLVNPAQVFLLVETQPNGLRLFRDECGKVFLQQNPDYPLVAESEVSREEMMRRCNEEVERINRMNQEREMGNSLAWINNCTLLMNAEVVKRGWVELLRADGLLYVRNLQGVTGYAFPNYAIRADDRLCVIGNHLFLKKQGIYDSFEIVRKSEDLTMFIVDQLFNRYMIINKPDKELEIQYLSKEQA
ncbi:MAG: DEAD/DEAH box helicase [Bacteroides sp.]